MDEVVVTAAIAEAEETDTPVAELSLERIAARAGMSRSTFFRRIGSRRALEDAVRDAGVDPGQPSPGVRELAIAAAAELIVVQGVGGLTVEEVARRVGCSVTSVHTQCGGRPGLLAGVFERYAPLPTVERLMAAKGRFTGLAEGVRAAYSVIMDLPDTDVGVLQALFAEALGRPDGTVMRMMQVHILPRITATVGEWLTTRLRDSGRPDLFLPVLLPLFIAPISVHLIARRYLVAADHPVPDREVVVDLMTEAFCRAIGETR